MFFSARSGEHSCIGQAKRGGGMVAPVVSLSIILMDGSPEFFVEESPIVWGLPRPGSQWVNYLFIF